MPSGTFTGDFAVRGRRFAHLAVVRLILSLAYLILELARAPEELVSFKTLFAVAFAVYAALIVVYGSRVRIRSSALSIQFGDLLFTVLLVLLARPGDAALPLLLFYFVLAESSLLHSGREVLLVTAVILVFYTGWMTGGEAQLFEFSYGSFMFLLVVAGVLAYYFSDQAHRVEGNIGTGLRRAAGQSEQDLVRAVEEALEELRTWRKCSRAMLAFWDDTLEYHAVCQTPAERVASGAPPTRFDSGREWNCLRANRLDFYANDLSLVDSEGKPVPRDFDLHPYVIQKFETYNAIGCALLDGNKPIGRLLLFNSVSAVGRGDWRKVRGLSRHFRDIVRHLLVVKHTEQDAYERERGRIAQDLHDGPLQSIISFEMRLEIIRKLFERDAEAASRDLASLRKFSRDLVSEMRTFVHGMRPMEAADSSLLVAGRRLVDGFQRESNVAVTFVGSENGNLAVPGKLGVEILQIVREALHNVYKHAQATHVLLSLEKHGGDLRISVDDNGSGFSFVGKYTLDELELLRIGPRSIKQRIRALGGELTLESNPGRGANIRASVPLF